MPHKCLNCGRVLGEDSDEILTGCESCGNKLFVYQSARREGVTDSEREDIVRDVEDFLQGLEESEEVKARLKEAMDFDLESIKILEDGVYEIDR